MYWNSFEVQFQRNNLHITNIMHFKEHVNILFFLALVFPASSREDANNCKGPGGFLPADPEAQYVDQDLNKR